MVIGRGWRQDCALDRLRAVCGEVCDQQPALPAGTRDLIGCP